MEATKMERFDKAHIYQNTRCSMRLETKRMFVQCLRDYERHNYIPTRRTRPALLKRRYSVDVNTSGWDNHSCRDFGEDDDQQVLDNTNIAVSFSKKREHDELELVLPSTTTLTFPTPHRYIDFNRRLARWPPSNDDIYLELDIATISNNEFLYMTDTVGAERWMRDGGLDMALTVLSRDYHCLRSKIGIASSVDSQVCRYPDPGGKEEYASRFSDKNWIFMPVNDGMLGVVNDGINGVHWAVVALDRIHKTVHYFDSLFVNNLSYIQLATDVSLGMLRLLDENPQAWQFFAEKWSPHQYRDNQCDFDQGACGPFVYTMVETAVKHIQLFQRDNHEQGCWLGLTRTFRDEFASQFHSYNVRRSMQRRIADAKMRSTAGRLSGAHDIRAIAGEDVELLSEPAIRFNASPRPAQPLETGPESNSDHESAMSTVTSSSGDAVTTVDIQLPSAGDVPAFFHTREDLSTSNGNDKPAIDIVPENVSQGEVDNNISNSQELDEGGVQ
ncbi:hypothetical protein EJ07DRAFT_176924 [Lizonia empirigonia]|nr:hypothetical protein EJ07DRAFT_176924 [Lizonia empirigonia]